MLLQRKLSNHAVFPLYTLLFVAFTIMQYLHYNVCFLLCLFFIAFTKIGRIKPVYEVMGCLSL